MKMRVILASKSAIRRQQLKDAEIPFEVIVSDADETPDATKSPEDQLAEIAMRKAQKVFEETADRGRRLIVAADQNIFFEGKLWGKPKTIGAARKLVGRMRGSDEIYGYTGNAVILADGERILQSINLTDTARMRMDGIDDNELEKYLNESGCLAYCGGISLMKAQFLHLVEGRRSTAEGMTLEYVKELLKQL